MAEIMIFFVVFNVVFIGVFLVSSDTLCVRAGNVTRRNGAARAAARAVCVIVPAIVAASIIFSVIIGSAFSEFIQVLGG